MLKVKHSIVIFILLLPALSLMYLMAPADMSWWYMLWALILGAMIVSVFYMSLEHVPSLRKNPLKHSSLILFGFIIVHFQYYVDFILGNASQGNLEIWVNYGAVTKSLLLSVIGLLCFFIGYSLRAVKRSRSGEKRPLRHKVVGLNHLKLLAFIFLCSYFLTVNPQYVAGGYGVQDVGAVAKYSSLAFNGALFAILLQACRNTVIANIKIVGALQFVKLSGYSTLGMTAAYLMSVILSGDRGPLIVYSMAYVFAYLYVVRKTPSWTAVVLGAIVAASAISFLGMARSLGDGLGFSEKFRMAYQARLHQDADSILPITQELAGSVNTLHHAVSYVPHHHDYLYGLFQLEQLIYAIPFSSRLVAFFLGDDSDRYIDVATFITWIAQGDNPLYGNGSSVVADFYIAFGFIGVAAGMFIFGWIVRVLELKMYDVDIPSVFWHAFSLVYFCNAIYIARSSFLDGFKVVVLVTAFVYLGSLSLRRRGRVPAL